MRLLPPRLTWVTHSSLAIILFTAIGYAYTYQCNPCGLMILSGPLSILWVALGLFGQLGDTGISLFTYGLPAILIGLTGLAMIFAHAYIPHPASAMVSLLGAFLWIMIALGVIATGAVTGG